MTNEELMKILENHKHWLKKDCEGWENMRANLRGANLSDANLRDADLSGADFRGANLRGANLSDANLRDADLSGAYLRDAYLRDANLSDANLRDADLSGADLSGAYLRDAYLRDANLSGAYLSDANLRDADGAWCSMYCPCEGEFVAWKKARVQDGECIVKLLIPADAKRLSATTEKCRSDKAVVLEIQDMVGNPIDECAYSKYDHSFVYKKGETVYPSQPFDEDRWNECSSGIHFFIDREMAKRY